jgi:thioredoxin reductase
MISGLERCRKATGIESFEISSFKFDERGCISVQSAGSGTGTLSAYTVISAVGVQPDLKFVEGNHQFRFTLKGTLEINPETFATSVDGVFGAGDVVYGPSTVAQAIGSGRRAAIDCARKLDPRNLAGWRGEEAYCSGTGERLYRMSLDTKRF